MHGETHIIRRGFTVQHLQQRCCLLTEIKSLIFVISGAASQAAMVDAFVAADTKRSSKGMAMAAGGRWGWGVSAEFRGRDKRLPPSRYPLLKRAQHWESYSPTATQEKRGHIPHRDSKVILT